MAKFLSGWQDSNLRPPAPKAGAITGLRYTPKILSVLFPIFSRDTLSGYFKTRKANYKAERQGLEPWRRLPVDRLAICSITALAPLHAQGIASRFAVANVRQHSISHNYFYAFFNLFSIFFLKHFTIKQIELTKNSSKFKICPIPHKI